MVHPMHRPADPNADLILREAYATADFSKSGDQYALVGNLGRSVDIVAPAPNYTRSGAETVIDCHIEGGGKFCKGVTIVAGLGYDIETQNLRAFIQIDFGNDGVQFNTILLPIVNGFSVTVPGSWVRAKVFIEGTAGNSGRILAQALLLDQGKREKIISEDYLQIAVAGSATVNVKTFAQSFLVRSEDMTVGGDTYKVTLTLVGPQTYTFTVGAGTRMTEWEPIFNAAHTITIENLGAAQLNCSVLQSIEL